MTVEEIRHNSSVTFLCSDVDAIKSVDVFSGVVSDNLTLIHVGDFVVYTDGSSITAQVITKEKNSGY